jgi:uncharacterized membrane protein (DUF2068 family)
MAKAHDDTVVGACIRHELRCARMAQHRDRGPLIIACFKLAKAALLLVAGVGLFSLLRRDAAQAIEALVAQLRLDPRNALVQGVAERLLDANHHGLELMGAATFLYAAIFGVEGVALLLGKPWAEALTLGVTISFIPIEVFDFAGHPSATKAAVIATNVAIAVYLAARALRRRRKQKTSSEAHPGR